MFQNIDELLEAARKEKTLKLAVAAAGDKVVLESVKAAEEEGIVEAILIGNKEIIKKEINKLDYDFNGQIINTKNNKESAHKAMELIADGKADFPMKGLISTKTILKALLDKKYGLRKDRLLSLLTMIYLEKEERIVFMTDGGMNIDPDLNQKKEIIENAVEMARAVGVDKPKVAPLAAVEKVNPAMPCTLDAATLSKMADRGQIANVEIDGPLAFDNAISKEAAEHKGIDSEVAGQADILLVPDIEAGNVLYKSLIFYAGLDSASLVMGAEVPMVLTSRADSAKTKFNSIALAKMVTLGMKD